jgi:hypothetical protein
VKVCLATNETVGPSGHHLVCFLDEGHDGPHRDPVDEAEWSATELPHRVIRPLASLGKEPAP